MLEITSNQFEQEVLQAEVPVLLDFYADWCGPCKMLMPVLEQLSTKLEGKAKFVKVNVDHAPDLAAKFGVMSIPTLVAFYQGKEVFKKVGLQQPAALEAALNELIK